MNSTGQIRYVRIEPWARELLLAPDEKLELIASGIRPTALRVVEASDTTVIYTEGCDRVRVVLDGVAYDHELPDRERIRVVPSRGRVSAPDGPVRTGADLMWDRELDG